jgi:cobalt-zinc-cadmium efflux system outer membrane protein
MKQCRNAVALVVLLWVIRAGALAQHEGHQPQLQPKPQPQSQSGHAEHQAAPAQPNPPQVPEEHKQHVMPGMEGMQMKSLDELLKTAPSNLLPRIGASQTRPSGPLMRLEKLEEIALARNPTLGQAAAEIRGAQGRSLQSGLYPNPTIGYSGEEIRGGASRGGQQGVFLAQTIVLGGKLGLNRKVAQQDVRLAEIEAEEQRMRVVNAVRLAYFQTLASQETLELDRRFVQLAQQTLAAAQRLHNIGARDSSEVLQSEIALQKAELRLKRQENQHRQVWRALAAVVGDPLLPTATLDGNLEEVPLELDDEQLTKTLITESPAARISRTTIARAEAAIQRAKREPIPDLQFRGGLQQNRELNDVRRAVGAQGFAEVGFMIPIFNRNQGNVRSARADLERAQQELNRVQLLLRERAAETVRTYEDARDTVERYRKDIIPRAERLYQTQLKAWGQMAVSYPVVLLAQQDLFDVQTEYVESLRDAQIAVVALKGFLLTDGLEAPARPGEVDMPVREINLPMSRGGMER